MEIDLDTSNIERKEKIKLELAAVLMVVAIVMTGAKLVSEPAHDIDCPEDLKDSCLELAENHSSAVEHMYTTELVDSGNRLARVKINETGKVAQIVVETGEVRRIS